MKTERLKWYLNGSSNLFVAKRVEKINDLQEGAKTRDDKPQNRAAARSHEGGPHREVRYSAS
jgi:hypothetical protein